MGDADGRVVERRRMALPRGHWRTTNFVAGLRLTGIDALMLIDGAMDGDAFETYVRQVVVPKLAAKAVVTMDNLSVHEHPDIREAIEAVGARPLFLPPYSPDFKPIEFAFSKLKALLRAAAERTKRALWDAVA